ncbi:MAG: hypothetical protein K0R09_2976 [Clostridiales bacterium]|jgi:hypothetical protein|nr:hypothetical protein [Clostridiales bacterium]
MDRNNQVTTAQLLTKAVRGINAIKSTRPEERNQLIDDVRMAIEELDNIRKYFEVVDDPELIDYAIYREKAAIMKLSYLLKKAKKNELLKCRHI